MTLARCGASVLRNRLWIHERDCPDCAALAVNTVVHAAVNKRGAYPNTDERREYMRGVMRSRRAKEKEVVRG